MSKVMADMNDLTIRAAQQIADLMSSDDEPSQPPSRRGPRKSQVVPEPAGGDDDSEQFPSSVLAARQRQADAAEASANVSSTTQHSSDWQRSTNPVD